MDEEEEEVVVESCSSCSIRGRRLMSLPVRDRVERPVCKLERRTEMEGVSERGSVRIVVVDDTCCGGGGWSVHVMIGT